MLKGCVALVAHVQNACFAHNKSGDRFRERPCNRRVRTAMAVTPGMVPVAGRSLRARRWGPKVERAYCFACAQYCVGDRYDAQTGTDLITARVHAPRAYTHESSQSLRYKQPPHSERAVAERGVHVIVSKIHISMGCGVGLRLACWG